MIQVSWAELGVLLTVIALIGPGLFHLGRITKQVDINTGNIKSIFGKLDDIHSFVKNGRK